jgi:TonB family protein
MKTIRTIEGRAEWRQNPRMTSASHVVALAAAAVFFFSPAANAARAPSPGTGARASDRSGGKRQLLGEQDGKLAIRDAGKVRVELEMGDVRILTGSGGAVSYHLRVEGPAGEPAPANGKNLFTIEAQSSGDGVTLSGRKISERHGERVWVSVEVTVPRNSPLDVNTQAGSIDVANIDARLRLETGGGNLTVGRVGGDARLESGGGHITVQDVAGQATAETGGGHILAGRIHGDAVLRTGGGHIRVAAVDGTASLETGGGNVFLQQAGARLIVSTGGGRIVIGEAAAGMQAKTGGGGIRILRMVGPSELQTGAGAIFLSQVQGSVRASTASGGITAWLVPPVPPAPGKATAPKVAAHASDGSSELESGNGDIMVYLPWDLGVNVEATLENSEAYHIDVDPALALKVTSGLPGRGGALRAEAALNGGGPRVRLKAEEGNIRLRLASVTGPTLLFDQAKFEAELQKSTSGLEQMLDHLGAMIDQQFDMQLKKCDMEMEMQHGAEDLKRHARDLAEHAKNMREQMGLAHENKTGVWGDRVVVSGEDLRQRILHRVEPVYPEKAKRQQLEGTVRLRVAVDGSGNVEDVKVLSGSALFTQAAAEAVRQWRFEPMQVEGKPVPVVGEVAVTFRLP